MLLRSILFDSQCFLSYLKFVLFHSLHCADIKYSVEPLDPTDLNLRTPPQSGIPIGNLDYQFPGVDHRHCDIVMHNGVFSWMSGWSYEGESGLHSRNDGLFHIIDYCAGLTYKLRDRHDSSTIVTTRADVTMGFGGCALVLVEEKDVERVEEATSDLRLKFQWIPNFDMLPFVFGIAVTRIAFEVFAMGRSTMHSLFRTTLGTDSDRWDCVVASVNIARVLRYFITNQMFVPVELNMDKWIAREQGKIVRIGMKFVEVRYAKQEVFGHLKDFYLLTSEHDVPHMERLYKSGPEQAIVDKTKTFRLVPVGLCRRPKSPEELRTAIQHIVQCVSALHALGFCHCDIRWSNIVWTESGWHLIDCTFATSLANSARLQHMSSTIKARYVFNGSAPWNQRYDFFQIGQLLSDSEFGSVPPFAALRDSLCDHDNDKIDAGYIIATLNDEGL